MYTKTVWNNDGQPPVNATHLNKIEQGIFDAQDHTDVLTTAPTQANPSGLKFVVLNSEPSTKYSGYVYLIKE